MVSRFALLSVCLAVLCAAQKVPLYDVVVASGSSSGFGAAIGAARLGARVLLLEDTPVLGGMLSNGISNIDIYSYEVLSGVFEEFRTEVKEHYRRTRPDDPFFQPRPRNIRHLDGRAFPAHEPSEGGRWEPHAAQEIFRAIAAKHPNLTILYNTHVTGVRMQGRRLAALSIREGGREREVEGKVFVDATHEADVAAWAGAPYRVGREARSRLEPHAGHIYYFNGTGEILPGSAGRQDRAIPSSGLRLTIQRYPDGSGDGHILKTPPPGYDPAKYALSPGGLSTQMPGGKYEMNVNPVGNELQVINWEWPEATHQRRRELYELYRNHALGYLYYLQHEAGRKEYGLPKDEFTDNGHVPYRIYLREGRRIEGESLMTEADVNPFLAGDGLIPPLKGDSIAVGFYPIDAKPVQPKTDASRPDKGEGDFYLINASTAFQVPYGAMIPKGVDGLLVSSGISATHVAFSAVRMDPTWMAIGQAAGIAAALGASSGREPRHIAAEEVQREALKQKLRIAFYWDLPLEHPAFEAIQSLSVRGVIRGYPDRTVQPDAPLTRAAMASLLARYFDLWRSVSDRHFGDVPHTHWAFRDIETLHDAGVLPALGLDPLWPAVGGYKPGAHAGFLKPSDLRRFEPDLSVTHGEWRRVVALLQPALQLPETEAGRVLTRAEAARQLHLALKSTGEKR